MSEGIINPPRIMEGRKMDWLNKTMRRELGEITPISMPRLAMVKLVTMKTSTNEPQSSGMPALKNGPAVKAIIRETRTMCTKLLNTGMETIERAGTPLILKLRNIPASRASTIGFGKPSKVFAIFATRIMVGIIVGANVGLSPVISKPIKI